MLPLNNLVTMEVKLGGGVAAAAVVMIAAARRIVTATIAFIKHK